MSTSRENSVIPRGRWVFEDTQKNWLAKCDVDGRVRPGGSPYMGDDTTAFEALDWLTRQPARFGLAMDIDVQPREFWRFEPVQLDLCLQTITSRNLTLPDEIDPGYKRLRVFIEDGNGERDHL